MVIKRIALIIYLISMPVLLQANPDDEDLEIESVAEEVVGQLETQEDAVVLPTNAVTEKFQDLIKKGDLYVSEKNYKEARNNYNQALNLLIDYQADKLLLDAYYRIAQLDYNENLPTSAIATFKNALNIADKLEDDEYKANIYTRLSYVLYDQFNYNNSAEYLLEAAKIYKDKRIYGKYAESVFNLAIIYRKLSDSKEEKYYDAEYKKYKKYVKGRFYMFSEDIDNIPYYIDLAADPSVKDFYQTSFVLLRVLNKVTARTYDFRVLVGSKMQFQTIELVPHSCFRSRPNTLPDNKLLLTVNEISEEQQAKKIFYGWLFSSSPSISTLEHPFYDVILLDCLGKE